MKNIFKVRGNIKIVALIVCILIPLLGGLLVGYLTRGNVDIYSRLDKPFFAPPSWVFQVVWPILYILMGVASYRIYMIRDEGIDTGTALFYYIIQLLLNYLWSFIFFSFRLYGLALVEFFILIIFLLITFIKFIRIDKISGFLLIPYMVWCLFAFVLNFVIWFNNER